MPGNFFWSSSPPPVHGDYSQWYNWFWCSRSCGGGTQTLIRYCNNPRPANGGKCCLRLGPARKSQSCNTQKCPGKVFLMNRMNQNDKLNLKIIFKSHRDIFSSQLPFYLFFRIISKNITHPEEINIVRLCILIELNV